MLSDPGRCVMRQNWHHLTFLHWPVPVASLRHLVPSQLEIETFDGAAWVGLVPFTMSVIRHINLPSIPGTTRFHETNVRTYVRHGDESGVWFFSLDASNRVAVAVARRWFHLPYYFAKMSVDAKDVISYRSCRGSSASCELDASVNAQPIPASAGSLEHFLVERYTLFAHTPQGMRVGSVQHEPYRVSPAEIAHFGDSLVRAAGIEVAAPPQVVLYSPGVSVRVFGLRPCRR